MVPNEAKNLLTDILNIEMFEMQRSLDGTLNATMARLAASGGLNSGRALLLLTQDGTNSLRSRGWCILGQLHRVLSAHKTPMTSETVEECSQILRDWIEREAQMVSSLVFSRPLAATPRSSNAIKELQAQLAQEVQRLHNRLSSELKLSAAAAQSDSKPVAHSLTFNAPIGVVQVGDGNQVNVHRHVDGGARTEISLALEALLKRLDQANEATAIHGELRQLVEEAKAEVEKPESNTLKLGATLRGIAETTKMIGSLSDAYQTFKPLLSQLGIHLP